MQGKFVNMFSFIIDAVLKKMLQEYYEEFLDAFHPDSPDINILPQLNVAIFICILVWIKCRSDASLSLLQCGFKVRGNEVDGKK